MQTLSGRAADHLIETLSDRIHTGFFSGGDKLPAERDLMEEFGTSRTVVREALRVLASQGLIVTKPRHRPVVRKVCFDAAIDAVEAVARHMLQKKADVKCLFDTRVLVEAMLVRQAAIHATKTNLKTLDDALDRNARAVSDPANFYRTDAGFHRVLYQMSGNKALPAIHKAYTSWLRPHWEAVPPCPGRNKESLVDHTRIRDAIRARDPDAAERALRDHLADAWTRAATAMREP